MSEYELKTNAALIGKTVKSNDLSGHSLFIEFTDGTVLYYSASDGGYYYWSAKKDGRDVV